MVLVLTSWTLEVDRLKLRLELSHGFMYQVVISGINIEKNRALAITDTVVGGGGGSVG